MAQMTTTTTIRLSELANEIERELIDEADALRPGNEPEMIVIELVAGRPVIVDGFHRVAGYLRWARETGRDAGDVEIIAVATDDEDLASAAAEPGDRQRAALDAIYAALLS
jgi:hypothetical protein